MIPLGFMLFVPFILGLCVIIIALLVYDYIIEQTEKRETADAYTFGLFSPKGICHTSTLSVKVFVQFYLYTTGGPK